MNGRMQHAATLGKELLSTYTNYLLSPATPRHAQRRRQNPGMSDGGLSRLGHNPESQPGEHVTDEAQCQLAVYVEFRDTHQPMQPPTGEHEGTDNTPSEHKQTKGWTLHTEVRPSLLEGAGMGLFMCERAKKGERIARYYGELIGPEETKRRRETGAQYILRASSKQFLDAEAYIHQRGRYANDGGRKNNARISTVVNKCPVTGLHWVSILARKTILPGQEVYVPYGRDFKRPWRMTHTAPAMMAVQLPGDQPSHADGASAPWVADAIARAAAAVTTMSKQAMANIARLWNSAVRHAHLGQHKEHHSICRRIGTAMSRAMAATTFHTQDYADPGPHGPRHSPLSASAPSDRGGPATAGDNGRPPATANSGSTDRASALSQHTDKDHRIVQNLYIRF